MQTNTKLMRLLAVIMTAVMMLTAIPFTSFAAAADESTDYVSMGTASDKEVIWRVLEKKADGSLVLITKDFIAKTKYTATAVFPDYETSALKTAVDAAITLTDGESASLADTTMSYVASDNGTATTKSLAVKFAIPTMADYEAYGLVKSTANYFLADAVASGSTNKQVYMVNTSGVTAKVAATMAQGYRIMVTVKADGYAELPAVDGLTYTANDGTTAVKYGIVGGTVKLNLDASYSESDVVVKFGGTEAAGTDGVYTVGAGTMTVEGVQVNPADYTAYNAAVAKTEGLVEEHYTEESWAALATALATDVSNLTAVDQAKIDEAAAAIEAALAGLEALPAELDAYKAAVARAKEIQASSLYNLNYKPDGSIQSINALITIALKNEKTILTYTIDKQAEVDAATKTLNDYCDQVPYKNASLEKWTNAVRGARTLDTTKYDPEYVADVIAKVEAIVAENDYSQRTDLDIRNQEEIDAAAAQISAIYADKDNHFIQTDFTALEAALERAATYAEENYYKDEDVKREEEVGGTAAWTTFVEKQAAAQNYLDNKDKYTTAFSSQSYIDAATEQLVTAMDKLDTFIRLSKWCRFVKDVKWFFSDLKYEIEGIIALLKTVAGLLGMLFRGEIDLYGLFELLGVDQEVLDILIKLGIKPKEYTDPGADTTTPDAAA